MVINLGEQNSIFNQFVAELRSKSIQHDSMRFRRNLERIGEVFAYEISKKMDYTTEQVQTPLGTSDMSLISEQPVIANILRAGLPLHQGILNYFDKAENTFISAYRKHTTETDFEIEVEYLATPSLENKTLILCDPMLATGRSMLLCHEVLLKKGTPRHTHVVAAIASKQGVEYLTENMDNITLWVGAVDKELTDKAYISPGLGDAGDLAFGNKL